MDDDNGLILIMCQEKQIFAEEINNLLDAHNSGKEVTRQWGPTAERESGKPWRWLRMVVKEARAGKSPTNILTSLGVINIGFEKETHFIPMVTGFGNDENLKAVQASLPGQTAEVFVNEAGEHDKVFIE